MSDEIAKLSLAAVSIGFLHTLLGPDHYVPFVAMARIGQWSLKRTLMITLICGAGHVASSIILGIAGIALGVAVFKLENVESARGDIACWMLIAFGLVYFVWGVRRAIRNQPHTHLHVHENGSVHAHEHTHESEHLHAHSGAKADTRVAPSGNSAESPAGASKRTLTPWVLFTIFLFGPCEPLIPFLMYPAAKGSTWGLIWVTALFAAATMATMTAMVASMYLGASFLKMGRFERFGHATAGFLVLACGAAIKAGL
ncbi:MAG: hypothetical protein DCC65_00575 [Planctomycetota bacterium]|nr:MAG: hypothetical protein DCC65_00575 [Planctomycetota bacterium]